MSVTAFVCWLHEWQDLLGAVGGAIIGGVMGFTGAYVVARNQRKAERRAAVRVVIADLIGFQTFAEDLGLKFKDDVVDEKYWPDWLSRKLHDYCYVVSPMFDHHLPQLFAADDPKLAGNLMAFTTAYRRLQALLKRRDDQTEEDLVALEETQALAGYRGELAQAYKNTQRAAVQGLMKLEPEYLEMFGVKRG